MIRPSQFGNRWPIVQLGDAVEFLDHKRRPITESDRNPGPYPYYGANGIQGMVDGFIFDEPLVLVAEDGGHFGAPDRTIAYQVNGKCWVNNHAHVLRPRLNTDINYLTRVLEQYDVTPVISGTTRGKLTKGAASVIEIPLPPLPEQKRIAAILDKADAIRRKRQEALRLTDDFLRSVFLDMFGDPVSNSRGYPSGTIRDLVDSANYGTSEKAHPTDGAYPVLRMNNLTYAGGWDFGSLKYVDLEQSSAHKYLVSNGQMLFNRTNSKELVGKTAVYRRDIPMAYAGYLVRVTAKPNAESEYISAYLNSKHGKAILLGMCKSIVGMANINAQEMLSIPILLPPVGLQKRFGDIVRRVEARRAAQRQASQEAETLFSALQQQAFSGQL